MSENSKIEWCDHTLNPWIGCAKVSPGCDNCYAEAMMDTRLRRVTWGAGQLRSRTSAANWREPVRWNAQHQQFFAVHGRRQRVFCASLADVFDNAVPAIWRRDLGALIESTPNLDWLLLTKRIGNAAAMLVDMFPGGMPDHVWLGATVVNQNEADRDVPKLLATPARVRFLSIEPMLGPIDLNQALPPFHCDTCDADYGALSAHASGTPIGIDWVIAGGESGHRARPAHPDWFRSLRDQCAAAGVPFMFKQWGEYLPWTHFHGACIDDRPEQTRFQTMEWTGDQWGDVGYPLAADSADGDIDGLQCVGRVGKRAAGRLLDGVEHNGFPEVSR
ncbi:phage Gp37/Gp68 family protein [Burkholderia glumae]|uniref:Phage Gp37/Gp68 family protein n=1 Tax=Burkholderia glumae TaxID=337 RepID=A0ABY5BCD4_BURGL|nr:phage Gp37/Gp68 family protein [Burkholderia glumae]KHJ64709.1 phage Gp37Gp68 [Burkholderia glumae]USS44672.1 phage Gp37/Gp68 family protein [Burkholderia glumae]